MTLVLICHKVCIIPYNKTLQILNVITGFLPRLMNINLCPTE